MSQRTTQKPPNSQRYMALDGCRGIAALLVVLFHIQLPNHVTVNPFVRHGYLAVDLFFVLSGFVIAASYSDRLTNLPKIFSFLGLRFFRVYPLHLTMLAAFVAFETFKLFLSRTNLLIPTQIPFTHGHSVDALILNVFLLQSLDVLPYLSWNTPSWSISCEFVAYVLFGIGFFTLAFRNRISLIAAGLFTVGGYAGLVTFCGTLDVTYDYGIVRCVCGFFLGMAIFEFAARARMISGFSVRVLSRTEIAVLAAIVAIMTFCAGWMVVFIIPAFVALVTVMQEDRGLIARALASPVPQFLGRISYSVYMTHSFVLTILLTVLKRVLSVPTTIDAATQLPVVLVNPWIGDLLVGGLVAAVVAIASLTYSMIEEPARQFGHRFVPALPKSHLAGVPGAV
jgi:peptidoglycan/LPS O-acetylase OafA/YrhL